MSKYVVIENVPGYLPESDPVEFDTIADVRLHLAEVKRTIVNDDLNSHFNVETPLRQITRKNLLRDGELVYGGFDNGYWYPSLLICVQLVQALDSE